ncbi:hypothetical protein AX14_004832 [Amanita brunnescens Koide BX004]|nr:hypothetical protein AX14_004832 [Amanita brunnescens Koide BX004]
MVQETAVPCLTAHAMQMPPWMVVNTHHLARFSASSSNGLAATIEETRSRLLLSVCAVSIGDRALVALDGPNSSSSPSLSAVSATGAMKRPFELCHTAPPTARPLTYSRSRSTPSLSNVTTTVKHVVSLDTTPLCEAQAQNRRIHRTSRTCAKEEMYAEDIADGEGDVVEYEDESWRSQEYSCRPAYRGSSRGQQ